jgi:hypothetical protein
MHPTNTHLGNRDRAVLPADPVRLTPSAQRLPKAA